MSMSYRHVIEQPLDGNGNPYPGAKLFSYNTGGLVARTVYSDAALTIPITQPVIADSNGKFPNIFVQAGTYRYILKTSADVVITDQDNVDPGLSGSSGALPVALGGTGATTSAAARSNLGVPSTAVTTGLDGRVTTVEQKLNVPLLNVGSAPAYAAVMALDFTSEETKTITLTGNITFSAPTVIIGQRIRIIVIQDATGGRTAVWNAAYRFPGGTPPSLSFAANSIDVFEGFVRAAGIVDMTAIKIQDARPSGLPDVILEDQRASGTAGGTATLGSDETRTLNTEVTDRLNICALAGNQFTLSAPGTYYIEWSAPANIAGKHQSILRNITAASDLKRGRATFGASSGITLFSDGQHSFQITASTVFEIKSRVDVTTATNGYGIPGGFGQEIYTTVKIWKVV